MISTEVYMDILAFKRQGHSIRWIARKLGIHRETVKKHLEELRGVRSQQSTDKCQLLRPDP